MTARIVIITRAFPYLPGEQFVEPEASFWARDEASVVVMPWAVQGDPRPVPEVVTVDPVLSRISRRQRQTARLKAPLNKLFWHELGWLARHGRLNRATALEVVRGVGGALVTRDVLQQWIQDNGPIDVVYTYWWDVWTYGAQLLKGNGVGHVVTRAHGYDLYEYRHPSGFLSGKRSLGPHLDAFLAISRDGEQAALDYGLARESVQLAPLGVALPDVEAPTSPDGELHVVSTATFTPVKRLDRMIDGLAVLCREHPELRVVWTHFGEGELRGEIEARLEAVSGLDNLTATLRGNVPNGTIREHFTHQPVDVFVNTSESEGVPVSIMEAMAFGVPALAPAVGGIGDMVPADGPGGSLMSDAPDAGEIAATLWAWRERAKLPRERAAARAVIAHRYDEAKNYSGLMDQLIAMAAS